MPASNYGARCSLASPDKFDRPASAVIRDMFAGGVNLPWNLALAATLGLGLMFSRLLFGVDGGLAHMHHVVGALTMFSEEWKRNFEFSTALPNPTVLARTSRSPR